MPLLDAAPGKEATVEVELGGAPTTPPTRADVEAVFCFDGPPPAVDEGSRLVGLFIVNTSVAAVLLLVC